MDSNKKAHRNFGGPLMVFVFSQTNLFLFGSGLGRRFWLDVVRAD
jgi:hypothetical protein